MVNSIVLVGRVARMPELRVTENGKKTASLTLAVQRGYKNVDGQYETDFLDCTLWTNVAENTATYCKTGDMVSVRGRVQTRIIESPEGTRKKKTEIVADRITFLASANHGKDESED